VLRKFSAFVAEPSYGLEGIPNAFVWAVAIVGACQEVGGIGCCTIVVGGILVGTFPLLVNRAGLWIGGAGSLWLGAFPLMLDGCGF
jgi:hypothetical protein